MTGRARFHEHACYTNSFPRLGPYSVEHHHVSSSRWADDVNNNYANGGHGPESFHLRNRNGYHQIDDSFTATGSRNKETAVKRAHSCIDATHDRDSMYPNAMSPLEDFPESGSSEPLAVCYDQIISLEPYSFSSSSSSRSVSSSCSSSSSFSSSSSLSSSCDSPSTTSSSSHSTSAPVPTCLSTLPALTCVQQSAVTTTPVTAFQETMAPSSASLAINFFMRAPSPSSLPRDSLPPERPQNDIIPTSTALTCEKDTDKDHPPPCCESVPEHAESQREIDSSSCTPCSDIDSISALCLTPTDTECRTMIRTQPVSANGASEAGSTSPDVSSTQLLTSDVANPQMAFGRAEEWKTVDTEAEERRSIEAVSRTPGEGKTAKVSHNDTGTASSTEFARPGGIVFSEGIAKSSGAIQVGSNLLETCAAVPKVNWGSDRKMSMDERVISGLRSHLDTYAGDKDDENNNNTSASRRSILPCRRNTSVAERSIWRKRCESETDADSKEDSTSAMSRLHQPDRRRASMGEHFIRRMRKELDVLEAEKDNDDDNFSTMTEVEDELNTSAFWRRAHARRKSRATMLYMMTIPDPNNQKLNWTKPPLTVLIIRKHMDESVLPPFIELVVWLVEKRNMLVYVENSVMEEPKMAEPEFLRVKDRLRPFTEGKDDLTDKVDFIICLGGDGTLLYASSLFQSSVPPVMAFNMGSLGFLTPFEFYKDFRHEVDKVLKGTASLLLRYRLKCVVIPYTISDGCIPHVKNIGREYISAKTHKLVLNEIVVDRGPSSYLCNLDLYIENRMVTSVQGDGLIISTPTGSTAYAVAAGASMIHPSVPCILITPICPHSLSFRPIVVPAGVEIKVMLCPNARGTAMVSFDGRDRQELHQGDSLRITTALYPVPSICATDQIEDWFDGLAECLHWNVRRPQLPLHPTSSLTSIESFESDAMTNSQHSVNGFSVDKNSHSTNFAPTAPDDTDQLHGT